VIVYRPRSFARTSPFLALALVACALALLAGPLAATLPRATPPGPANGIPSEVIEAALVPPAAGAGPIPLAMAGGGGGGIGEGIPTNVEFHPLIRIDLLPNRVIRGDERANTLFGGPGRTSCSVSGEPTG